MRPRELPAEDRRARRHRPPTAPASMRPRELPAEDRRQMLRHPRRLQASMRPRELPAEDPDENGIGCLYPTSFNEAAGVTRGRPSSSRSNSKRSSSFNEAAGVTRGRPVRPVRRRHGGRRASMRPRELPAEDPYDTTAVLHDNPCFNEAAGVTRGRPDTKLRGRLWRTVSASMRPRELPAEDRTTRNSLQAKDLRVLLRAVFQVGACAGA